MTTIEKLFELILIVKTMLFGSINETEEEFRYNFSRENQVPQHKCSQK